jgi:hypothetical protein
MEENVRDSPTHRPPLVKQIFEIIEGIDWCRKIPLKDWCVSYISNFRKISRELQSTLEHQSAWRQVPISRELVKLQSAPEIF